MTPYVQDFECLILDALGKNIAMRKIPPRDVDVVLCTGGGFEMLWAREAVAGMFASSQIHLYKNTKLAVAEGAAWVAATILGVANGQSIMIEDNHQLDGDIGIKCGDDFLPLALGDTYWWQPHEPKLVMVTGKVSGELGFMVTKRIPGETEHVLASAKLTGLPTRPKGTTRLRFGVDFMSDTCMKINVSDIGFGELFPKSGYQQEIIVQTA